jgi:lysophospholipase L1-like esterase
MRLTRHGRIIAAAAALLLVGAAPRPGRWTPAWTASMWQATDAKQAVAVENATISFAVRVGLGGDKVRLRLSNEYGPALQVAAASVRIAGGRTIPVTFGGRTTATLGAGAITITDPAPLTVKPFDIVQVSLYLPGSVRLDTVHGAPGARTLISPPGDHSAAPFEPARTAPNRPLLAGIDVSAASAHPVVVAFGDSITDNGGCANDAMPICRWSDALARRLAQAGKPQVVVTQAISGNRVISAGTGPSALERLDRDVLALPGVTHIVLLEGINDIGNSGRVRPDGSAFPRISYEQLIAGYREIVARVHKKGIKVMALTVLPFQGAGYYSDAAEAMRVRVNDWMRTSRTFDAVLDMEKVVADPANPKQLDPALHGGDHLHPNGQGETRMGEAIPLDWFG